MTSRLRWSAAQLNRFGQLRCRIDNGAVASPEQTVLLDAIERAEAHAMALRRTAVLKFHRGALIPSPTTPKAEPRVSAILIKPVGDRCNLRCTYCYEGADDERRPLPLMSETVLERIIRDAIAQASESVSFLWHGGEPLLAGLDFFRRGIEFQRRYNTRSTPIVNAVQTNGTLLNDEWIDFFFRHGFRVGVSIDGPEHLHDTCRLAARARGSYARVIKGVDLLKRAGMPFGAIVVITPHSADHAAEVFRHFLDLGVDRYDIHPQFGMEEPAGGASARMLPTAPTRILHPRAFATFVVGLFEAWIAAGRRGIRIRTFDDIFQARFGQSPSTCYFSGNCTRIIGFEPDGSALPCTRPFDRSRYTFGNITTQPLSAILNDRPFALFRDEDIEAQSRSRECPWQALCHNGCPQHRLTAGRQNVAGANLYCSCQSGIPGGHSEIFGHIVGRMDEILARPDSSSLDDPPSADEGGAH